MGTGRTASSTGLAIQSEVRYSVLRGSLMLVTVCHYLVLNRSVAKVTYILVLEKNILLLTTGC